MAELVIDNNNLVLRLTGREKVMAVRRNDIVVPLDQVTGVRRVPSVRAEVRGLRVPGFEWFGRKVGTWRTRQAVDFLFTDSYGAGVVIELSGHELDRIVTTLPLPEDLMATA